MRNYCAVSDSRYLPQLLVLYESLKRHSSEKFRLFVLPIDDECKRALEALDLFEMRIVDREHLESVCDLAAAKANRTYQEYCWTLASQLCHYLLNLSRLTALGEMVYLDADLMFFSDPRVIFDEIADRSIAVVPHRLAENDQKERLSRNGIFNVSLVYFRNNIAGRVCLAAWSEQCREWCYARNENGKFGDQGFLDEWPRKYGNALCVIQNIGVGVAPWNVSTYEITERNEAPYVDGQPITLYHFHEFRNETQLTNYQLSAGAQSFIYRRYVIEWQQAQQRIAAMKTPA